MSIDRINWSWWVIKLKKKEDRKLGGKEGRVALGGVRWKELGVNMIKIRGLKFSEK